MHVEAGADAGGEGNEGAFQSGKILLVGEFDVFLRAGDEADLHAGVFEQPGVVGGVGGGVLAVQGQQRLVREGLRGLGAVEVLARDGSDDDTGFDALERVGDRDGGDGAFEILQRGE